MRKVTRRDFIRSSLVTAVGAGIASSLPGPVWSKVLGANDDVRVAVVGVRGMGRSHIEQFHKLPDVRVVALCDVDQEFIDLQVKKFTDRNEKVDTYTDIRKLLEDKSIDAIVVATPNHWHCLMTIWACQAGKDVYVEKPISHNIREGRKMVEAARKYNRIVQAGTQSRSSEGLREAFEYMHQGNLGKILFARAFVYKRRESLGRVSGPQPIPKSVDYNLWTGPAPLRPLMRKNLHYDWHWVWPTGNGEIGNVGCHHIDVCRWALRQDGLPERVMSIGGRFGYVDDGTTANTHIAIFDYKPAPIIFEARGLSRKKDDTVMDHYRGIRQSVVIQCENGYLAGSYAYDNDGKLVKKFVNDGGGGHYANFIKAMRSRRAGDLNAEIIEGYRSVVLSHIGNIAHRTGGIFSLAQIKEAIGGNEEMLDSLERFQSHLEANGVDLSKRQATLGRWLKFDAKSVRFVDNDRTREMMANALLARNYRKPFVVPEKV